MAENIYYKTKNSVKLVKAPPIFAPTITLNKSNSEKPNTFFNNTSFQFAARYHYDDGEISAISPYSRVAFDSNMEETATESSHLISVEVTDFTAKVSVKNLTDNSIHSSNVSLEDSTIGYKPGDSISNMKIDYVKTTKTDFKVALAFSRGLITDNNENIFWYQVLRTFDITDNAVISNKKELIIYKNPDGRAIYNSNVVIVPSNPSVIYVSYCSTKDLHTYKVINTSSKKNIGHIDVNDRYNSDEGVAVSDNGKYVYQGYGDDINKYVNDGSKQELPLYVDDGSGSKAGERLFDQGNIDSVTCSTDGKNVFALVRNRINEKEFKVARSYDYGESWEATDIIGTNNEEIYTAIIQSSESGSIVAFSYTTTNNKSYIRISKDKGVTFSDAKLCVSDVKFPDDTYSFNISSNGKVFYIGYVSSSDDKGKVIKSDDDGVSFPEIMTGDTVFSTKSMFSVKSDFIFEEANDINYIENDINSVSIDAQNFDDNTIKYIEVLAIDNNKQIAYSIVKDMPQKIGVVDFFNNTTYKTIPKKDLSKLYDNVPLKARSFCLIQNSLTFGGYTDGYSVDVTPEVYFDKYSLQSTASVVKSLKYNAIQSYAIIYYDEFNRSSDAVPIGDMVAPMLTSDKRNHINYVRLRINHKAPSWAKYYTIARKPLSLNYEIIDGFDSVHIYNDKLYLDFTSFSNITIPKGGRIELVAEKSDSAGSIVYNNPVNPVVLNIIDVVSVSNNKVSADGSTVILPSGKYVVVSSSDVDGYSQSKSDFLTKNKYTTSIFYAHDTKNVVENKIYQETSYKYRVINGFHEGNQYGVQTQTTMAFVNMDNDFDVVMPKNKPIEVYRLSDLNKINTLGRPNLDSDNFRQIDRYASLCASEPYVDDTNFNGLSSFNLGLLNYKDLDKVDGEIKLLDSAETNVEVYQRDKVSRIMYKKNILSMADGQQALSQTQDIWGEQVKYASEFGLSHPESFAKWANDAYYIDANRGVVIRKATNGMFPISSYGMNDYFNDLLSSANNISGYYDPKTNMYHAIVDNENIAFSEKSNGWEYRCSLIPDLIINDDFNTYSFKDNKLYKHDNGRPNEFYGVKYKTMVETYINDNPDIVKVFNAIQINGTRPESVDITTNNDKTTIHENLFELNEDGYYSYIPTGTNDKSLPVNVLGVVINNVVNSKLITMSNISSNSNKGDMVFLYNPIINTSNPIGTYIGLNNNVVELDTAVDLSAGNILITMSKDSINGKNLRARYGNIKTTHKEGEYVKLDSIVLDVDVSNQ